MALVKQFFFSIVSSKLIIIRGARLIESHCLLKSKFDGNKSIVTSIIYLYINLVATGARASSTLIAIFIMVHEVSWKFTQVYTSKPCLMHNLSNTKLASISHP